MKRRLLFVGNPEDEHCKRYLGRINYDLCQVTVLSPTYIMNGESSKYSVFSKDIFQYKRPRYIRYFYAYVCFVLSNNFDVIICFSALQPLCWLVGLLAKGYLWVITIGSDVFLEEQIPLTFFEKVNIKRLIRKADRVSVLSAAMRQKVIANFGVKNHKIKLEFLDLSKEWYECEDWASSKKYFQNHFPVIFSPRMLAPLYQQENIIYAIQLLKKEYPNILLVQSGFSPDAQYESKCKRLVNRLNLQKNVHFLKTLKNSRELINIYDSSDIVIMIPKSDGMPSSMIEAWSRKKPVLVSNIYNYSEKLDGRVFMKSAIDQSSLGTSIKKLVSNEALRENLISNANLYLEERRSLGLRNFLDLDSNGRSGQTFFSRLIGVICFLCFLIEPFFLRLKK